MWTKITISSYVPPGFIDSGTSKMVVYCTRKLRTDIDNPAVFDAVTRWTKRAISDTEVTSFKVLKVEWVEPFTPDWTQNVQTDKHEWAGVK